MERIVQTAPDVLVADGLVTVPEAAGFLALGKSRVYELMAEGAIPSVKVGGARRIPRRALVEFAARLLAGDPR